MINNLAEETSPYLLQHKENPVAWYPWGKEALEKSRELDKPIFLSIGYAACHWCHVMAHESFEDPATAAIMNEHFINIKVDREERPDLDNIYMNAIVAMTGQGGWPMSIFLTPDGRPFFGGTYFPPVQRFNMPSFKDVLLSVARAWERDRERIETTGAQLYQHVKNELSPNTNPAELNTAFLDQGAMTLAQHYDWKDGGWGQAPKFPQPMIIEFLINRATRGDQLGRDLAVHALKSMARGGMYDVIGGGFHRYSVDKTWLVPHFEKMLYDNALLARAYLHGYLLTRDEDHLNVCQETLDFVLREMTDPEGGFYSSLDADSEGEEGVFYIWSQAEVEAALPDSDDFALVSAAYGISAEGNFEGANILQRALNDESLAVKFNLSIDRVRQKLSDVKRVLLAERGARIRPGTDDKILTAWNGLMVISFAEAARYLGREDYLTAARRNAAFLLKSLEKDGRLHRSWRAGAARHQGYLEDYAALILALLALYQSDPDLTWYEHAVRLAEVMIKRFQDPAGGFFDTADDHETLIVRPKDIQDNATPSGNALAVQALLILAAFTGEGRYRDLAEHALGGRQVLMARYPTAFGMWCQALDFAMGPVKEVALLDPGKFEGETQLAQSIWSEYRPYLVVARSGYPPQSGSPPLLLDRPPIGGGPTAYVCTNFVCLTPTTDLQVLLNQLKA